MRYAIMIAVLFSRSWAGDLYITQAASGSDSGADCANAHSASWFNANATGGSTYHLCGTFTGTANQSYMLNVPASGSAGNPLIVLAEAGAVLTAPYWSGDFIDSGSGLGAIVSRNHNYVILDGGTNGVIQNTNNGTALTYQAKSFGMFASGSNVIVRNWKIQSIYVPTNSVGGSSTADLIIGSSSNVTVCNNTLSDAYAGLVLYGVGASSTQVSDCTSNAFGTGTNVFLNTFQQNAWNINFSPGAASSPNIYANNFGLAGNFGIRVGGCNGSDAHTDGIITYATGAGVVLRPYVYNNLFYGDLGNGCPTGFIFPTYGTGYANSGSVVVAFNNLMINTGTASVLEAAFWGGGGTGYVVGPHSLYNNTIVNPPVGLFDPYGVVQNNIISTTSSMVGALYYDYTQSAPFSRLNVDWNSYYSPGASQPWFWGNSRYTTLAAWQSACVAGSGTGCDGNSLYGNPGLNSSYRLNVESTAAGHATNLTSLCNGQAAPLCYDKPPIVGAGGTLTSASVRPATGPWDIGAYQYVGAQSEWHGPMTMAGPMVVK